MLKLFPNETVLLVIRRHWIVFAVPALLAGFLLVLPAIALSAAFVLLPELTAPGPAALAKFLFALYLLLLALVVFIFWMKYYLDAWIITDQRIIDIEQHGLFHREVSEIAMEKIQNVTIEIPGFLATVMKFGTIKIQTASESDFVISDVPDCYRAKDLILKYSRIPRQHMPHEPEAPLMAG